MPVMMRGHIVHQLCVGRNKETFEHEFQGGLSHEFQGRGLSHSGFHLGGRADATPWNFFAPPRKLYY